MLTYLLGWRFGWDYVSHRPDVIVVETDPPLLGLLGVLLSRWHRCRFIYYLQDLYPEVALTLGRLRPGIITKMLYWATQTGLRGADRIIVLGEDMRAKVMNRGIAAAKIAIVSNWADTDLIYPRPRTNPWAEEPEGSTRGAVGNREQRRSEGNGHAPKAPEDSLIVMYSGNVGLSQNLEHLLEAAEKRRFTASLRDCRRRSGQRSPPAQAKAWLLTNALFTSPTRTRKNWANRWPPPTCILFP